MKIKNMLILSGALIMVSSSVFAAEVNVIINVKNGAYTSAYPSLVFKGCTPTPGYVCPTQSLQLGQKEITINDHGKGSKVLSIPALPKSALLEFDTAGITLMEPYTPLQCTSESKWKFKDDGNDVIVYTINNGNCTVDLNPESLG